MPRIGGDEGFGECVRRHPVRVAVLNVENAGLEHSMQPADVHAVHSLGVAALREFPLPDVRGSELAVLQQVNLNPAERSSPTNPMPGRASRAPSIQQRPLLPPLWSDRPQSA